MGSIFTNSKKTEYIAKKFEIQDELKKSASVDLTQDQMTANISLLFETNAALNQKCKDLQIENKRLKQYISTLEKENIQLENQMKQYEISDDHGISL